MARRVTPGQTLSLSVPNQLKTITSEEEEGGRAGRGYVPLPKKGIGSPRPEETTITNCFKIACGDKVRSDNLVKRLGPPPSELFFKNGVRALWADKHRPESLSGFQCHADQTQQMKQLISQGYCPHLLLEGPSGAGKKALAIALLHDIFGDVQIRHEHRPFTVQGGAQPTITVPIVASRYHVEVNLLHIGEFFKDVLLSIFKEIRLSSEKAMHSSVTAQSDVDAFKLILVLHGEKLSEEAQHSLCRLMDRYGETCKLVLCCNVEDATLMEPILSERLRSRCQTIKVEVPSQDEMVRVLTQVAKKEDLSLPKAFAARIAEHCKDSLRKAIVQLEACKNYQYPFSLDQRVHISHWEEDVIKIVAEIVADPSSTKWLFNVRTKMQILLSDCVSPILILQKLLEEFLQRTHLQQHKKQICHWAGYFETRLRVVPNPISQLEAFLAKITSMYRTQTMSKPRRSFCSSGRNSLDHSLELEMSPSQHNSCSPFLAMKVSE